MKSVSRSLEYIPNLLSLNWVIEVVLQECIQNFFLAKGFLAKGNLKIFLITVSHKNANNLQNPFLKNWNLVIIIYFYFYIIT